MHLILTPMKKNLTVRIDPEVLRKARLMARNEGISLSAVVEKDLRAFVEEGEFDGSFVRKWVGRLSVPEPDPSDPRIDRILKKLNRAQDWG